MSSDRTTPVRVALETVQAGHVLVDCSRCGTIGVWTTRKQASIARTEHVCGVESVTPGKWSPADRAAPLVGRTVEGPRG